MCRWPRNAYIPRMNGKLSALYRNRCSCASDCRHRATRVHICDLLPYIRLCRRSMRLYPRSARRNRLPSRCGRDRACRRGCGFCFHWTSNRSSRDPVRPLSDRICNRSGCRYRRSSSPFPCRWGLSPRHDAPDRGCPDLYRRFQKCSASGSRSRNRPCNTRPEIRMWPRTSDTCRRAVPRTNGEFCSPLYYSSYRRASACRDCSTRGRQTCGLPCIFRGTRRTSPFPRSSRRSNLSFLCGCRHRNGCGCRRHWSD